MNDVLRVCLIGKAAIINDSRVDSLFNLYLRGYVPIPFDILTLEALY